MEHFICQIYAIILIAPTAYCNNWVNLFPSCNYLRFLKIKQLRLDTTSTSSDLKTPGPLTHPLAHIHNPSPPPPPHFFTYSLPLHPFP